MSGPRTIKLGGTDAFVVVDLNGAEASSGPVRRARKVLPGGVRDLARSQTYTYAALGMRRGGASAGINAADADRAEAVAAFVEQAAALVADGTYLPDPAKGVDEADLAPLRAADPRSRSGAFAAECEALSAAAAAEAAIGLDGRTAVIEGAGVCGPALAAALAERGATVVSTDPETWSSLQIDIRFALADAIAASGGALTWSSAPVDIVFAGSKMGAVNHGSAESLQARLLVPCGRLPFTAKALAVCRRRGIGALPDFVTLAGSTIAAWSDPETDADEVRSAVAATVTELVAETADHPDGPFLAACYAAESFLATWQDELPFGRPLAP